MEENIPHTTLKKVLLQGAENADPDEYQKNLKKMQECAKAIGNLCFAWSSLELMIDRLISSLLDIKEKPIAETLLSNIDQREKIQIVLGLCYLKRLSDDWFSPVKWCMNEIDSNLRSRRNRFIHDAWHVSPQGIKKVQAKSGFKKPKSFQTEYYTKITEEMNEDSVWSLVKEIQNMVMRIDVLWLAGFEETKNWRHSLEELSLMPTIK